MKKIGLLSILTFFILAFVTCGIYVKTERVNLPEKYKPIYNVGDSVIFKSNFGAFDTFICDYYFSRFIGYPLDASHEWDIAYEFVDLSWSDIKSNKAYKMELNYYEKNFQVFYVWSYFMGKNQIFIKIDTSIVFLDTIVEDYVLKITSTDTTDRFLEYYTPRLGLLEYKNKNGEIFKIHKYIIQ